ncbi:UNVERIFIED_CONTAM: hypothetical protein GTU68_003574 [Idotea baltica]|nr:hypothetical protein [Idotea baltica]
MQKFDFLVVGGGVSGLSYALKVAKKGSVAVLFKKKLYDCSTSWAQGGIAAVSTEDDDPELHKQDTLRSGAGICDEKIVDIVVNEGPERVEELIKLGASFDKSGDSYHLHQEGGHSRRRIFHSADTTGWEIQKTLLEACCAIDILTSEKLGLSEDNTAHGVYVLMPNKKIELFLAKKILIATGGSGKLYIYTSNPDVATGDGIAMCHRAGVEVKNMEFFQFHPTCLYHPEARTFLITEAMRGEGAILKRINGDRFMPNYHPDGELAPRDIVARAIDNEIKTYGDDYVYLDISHRDEKFIKEHFPAIYKKCLEYGFDITKTPIPVVPAAHYCCGGVVSGEHGETTIKNLYVAGECAHTGLHGANRLASNSLLEGLVFADRAAKHSLENLSESKILDKYPAWDSGTATNSDERVIIAQNWDEIRRLMWNYVGIVRSNKRLDRALRRSELISQEINQYYWDFIITSDLIELRNLSLLAELTIKSAIKRKESVGLHYNIDYPGLSDRIADTNL